MLYNLFSCNRFDAWQLTNLDVSKNIVTNLQRVSTSVKNSPSDFIHLFQHLCHAWKHCCKSSSESPALSPKCSECIRGIKYESHRRRFLVSLTWNSHTETNQAITVDISTLIFLSQRSLYRKGALIQLNILSLSTNVGS